MEARQNRALASAPVIPRRARCRSSYRRVGNKTPAPAVLEHRLFALELPTLISPAGGVTRLALLGPLGVGCSPAGGPWLAFDVTDANGAAHGEVTHGPVIVSQGTRPSRRIDIFDVLLLLGLGGSSPNMRSP